jgi:hypothetical protein
MAWIAGAIVGSSLIGASSANKAAQTQADAAAQSAAMQKQMFDIQNAQQAPYRQTGYNALNQIGALGSGTYGIYDQSGKVIGDGTGTGYLTQQFGPEQFQQGMDPGYAFRLAQGQRALQGQQNAAGGLLSGNALAAMQDYTQGSASQEYGNAFNRFQTQRGNIYNTLASMAGLGQTSLGQTGQMAAQTAQGVGSAIAGAGQATAAGQIGVGNALAGGLSQYGNQQYLSNLLGQRGNAVNLGVPNQADNQYSRNPSGAVILTE